MRIDTICILVFRQTFEKSEILTHLSPRTLSWVENISEFGDIT